MQSLHFARLKRVLKPKPVIKMQKCFEMLQSKYKKRLFPVLESAVILSL